VIFTKTKANIRVVYMNENTNNTKMNTTQHEIPLYVWPPSLTLCLLI
jgi:hypothetical protein